jgi:hypothetical protein
MAHEFMSFGTVSNYQAVQDHGLREAGKTYPKRPEWLYVFGLTYYVQFESVSESSDKRGTFRVYYGMVRRWNCTLDGDPTAERARVWAESMNIYYYQFGLSNRVIRVDIHESRTGMLVTSWAI